MAKKLQNTRLNQVAGANPKIRLWAIVGNGNAGKSTSIGQLVSHVGRGRPNSRNVLLRGGGYLQLYVRKQSLQEANRTPDDVVKETVAEAQRIQKRDGIKIACFNVLFAIRSDKVNELPLADEYLSYFVESGWQIESLVLLNYDHRHHAHYHSFGAPTCEVYESEVMVRDPLMHGWLVGQMRNHFKWA